MRPVHGVRAAARLACAALALLLGGCVQDCSTDVTHAIAQGTLRDASGAALGSAWVGVRHDESARTRIMTISVSGPVDGLGAPLRGHLRATRVRVDDGTLVYEGDASEELQLRGRDEVFFREYSLARDSDFQRLRTVILAGRVSIEVATVLSGAATLHTTLLPVHDVVPERSTCVRGSVNSPM